jgi:Trypsin
MSQKSPEQVQRELREAEFKLPEARKLLMALPGVIEVNVGIKESGGLATGEVVFQVLVEKKKALQDLPPEQRIPTRILGILTDVIPHELADVEAVLMGGSNINGSGGSGTLGAIGLATAANTHVAANTPLILTNKHVAEDVGSLVGEESTCDCKCCTCCDFGRVVDAQITASVDAAIATLNNGVRFSHEVILIGAVRGTAPAALNDPVVKHGRTTNFTRGQVTSITFPVNRKDGNNFTNQIRVAPVAPFTDMSDPGDSGSAYVNANTNQIIGLHHAGNGPAAMGNQIAPVLSQMKIDFPVMGTAGALPLVAVGLPDDGPSFHQAWAALKNDLERTEAGQYWMELVRSHASEVNYLINNDRETKMAWHRTHGPSFVSHYLKSVRQEDYRVPREIGGMRVENVIVSMAAALQRNASQELSTAITNHYLDVLQFVGNEDSARKVCERARTLVKEERTRLQRGEVKCPHNQAHSNN